MSDPIEFRVVDPAEADAREAVRRYIAEIAATFPTGFDPGDPVADEPSLRRPEGAFVVAYRAGAPVAAGGVRTYDGAAEIKRMWVDPDVRGMRLGSRLLAHLEDLAAELGHVVVRLDTNEALGPAIALYARAGYERVERYNDNPYATHFFAKRLTPEGRPGR